MVLHSRANLRRLALGMLRCKVRWNRLMIFYSHSLPLTKVWLFLLLMYTTGFPWIIYLQIGEFPRCITKILCFIRPKYIPPPNRPCLCPDCGRSSSCPYSRENYWENDDDVLDLVACRGLLLERYLPCHAHFLEACPPWPSYFLEACLLCHAHLLETCLL